MGIAEQIQGTNGRNADAQRHRNADRPFTADQPDFQYRAALHYSHHGHQAVIGKAGRPDRLSGLKEHFPESQLDRLEAGTQVLIRRAGQGGKQVVGNRHDAFWGMT